MQNRYFVLHYLWDKAPKNVFTALRKCAKRTKKNKIKSTSNQTPKKAKKNSFDALIKNFFDALLIWYKNFYEFWCAKSLVR
jgi:hypothetical protein